MAKGVLIDLTKCFGCGSCTVACKMYNKNEWIEDRAPTGGENAMLADENWMVVRKCRIDRETGRNVNANTGIRIRNPLDDLSNSLSKIGIDINVNVAESDAVSSPPPAETSGNEVWRFVKWQCLHCKEPACASSCFATAFRKTESGSVDYFPNLCVGCRYCMLACPFSIPKFEWGKALPMLTKCSMCPTRIENGDAPACVAVCPTDVMKFGEREELLEEAKRIIARDKRYVKHIYGENEVGGTEWIYISDKPFESLGFRTNLPTRSIPSYTSNYMYYTPRFGIIWAAILGCLYFVFNRRSAVKEDAAKEKSTPKKEK